MLCDCGDTNVMKCHVVVMTQVSCNVLYDCHDTNVIRCHMICCVTCDDTSVMKCHLMLCVTGATG